MEKVRMIPVTMLEENSDPCYSADSLIVHHPHISWRLPPHLSRSQSAEKREYPSEIFNEHTQAIKMYQTWPEYNALYVYDYGSNMY